jgi:hypothetical protein
MAGIWVTSIAEIFFAKIFKICLEIWLFCAAGIER